MGSQSKRAISVGGGKGGIGKSCFAANLAIALAVRGRRVVLVDTDIEGANLHTFVGINYPRRTLDDYLNGKFGKIRDIVLDTPVPHVQLISSAGSIMSLSGLKFPERQRFFKSVMQLDTDVIIFDVAAGSNIRIIDYFSLAPVMTILIEPVPTSLENAYAFLKNLLYRHLLRIFYTDKPTSRLIIDTLKEKQVQTGRTLEELLLILDNRAPDRTAQFKAFLLSLDNIYLIVNKLRTDEQLAIIDRFARVVKRYLMINIRHGGGLSFEPMMDESIIARTPFILQHPDSRYAFDMEKIIANLPI